MKDFQDFGASWACPSIQKWHPKKWLDNICNFNGYVSEAKKNIITPIVFELLNI